MYDSVHVCTCNVISGAACKIENHSIYHVYSILHCFHLGPTLSSNCQKGTISKVYRGANCVHLHVFVCVTQLQTPQLEAKCFSQQEQLDSLQEQLETEREQAEAKQAALAKELALRVDQVRVTWLGV